MDGLRTRKPVPSGRSTPSTLAPSQYGRLCASIATVSPAACVTASVSSAFSSNASPYMNEQQERPETYRRTNARFGSSARSSCSLVAASGVTSIVVALPSIAIGRSLPVLAQLRHAGHDRGESGKHHHGGASDCERRSEQDRRSTEEGAIQHPHALRPEGVCAHHSAADRSEERRVGKEGRSRWSPYH